MRLALAIMLVCASFARGADIIASSNYWSFARGWNLGVQGDIPDRSGVIYDVSLPPYNADLTGATDSGAAIGMAISDAIAGISTVYLPTNPPSGIYNFRTNAVTINKSVTFAGGGPNTRTFGNIIVGHSASGGDVIPVVSGGEKGSTNIVLSWVTNQFNGWITNGNHLTITQLEEDTNGVFQVQSIHGTKRVLSQQIEVLSRNGNTLTLSAPLIRDFTNQAEVTTRNFLSTDLAFRPVSKIVLRDFLVSGTNHVTGLLASGGALISAASTSDLVVSNVVCEWFNNYGLAVENSVRPHITYSTFRHHLTIGSSRSGLIFTTTDGYLLEDCIIDDVTVGWQNNGSCTGWAAFGVFGTNIISNSLFQNHNAHSIFGIIEHCVSAGAPIVYDGQGGSTSHQFVFRSRISSVSFKRWQCFGHVMGCVLGVPEAGQVYQTPEMANPPVYGVFELGFANISNLGTNGSTPPQGWNWPGTNAVVTDNVRTTNYPNPAFTVTEAVGPTNVLWGNFTNVLLATFENWGNGQTPSVAFQDGANTNRYYNGTNLYGVLRILTNYGNRILLNQHVTVQPGYSLYHLGANQWQQMQLSNKYTHTFTGNLVYTNAAGVVVWSDTITNRTIPISLVYPAGAPRFWVDYQGNALPFPAIGPDVIGYAGLIPAQSRYLQMSTSTPGPSAKRGAGRAKGSSSGGRRIVE